MKDHKEKDSSLGETFDQLLQDDNYKKINAVFKQTLNSVLEATKKGFHFAFEKWVANPKSLRPVENPKLVNRKAAFSKWGQELTTLGMIISIVSGIFLFLSIFHVFVQIVAYPTGAGVVLGLFLMKFGNIKQKQIIRLQKYLRELGSGTVGTINDFAIAASTTKEQVLKDLHYFMEKDVIKEGRLVEGNSIFILDRGTYEVYKTQYLDGGTRKSLEEGSWESEIRKDLNTLSLYLEGSDQELKEEILKLQERVSVILDYGIKHPESKQDLRKFSDYYLPTTLELVRRYRQFHLSDTEEANIAKQEIKESLQTVEEGFGALVDNLNTDLVMDTRSDISVMETLMKQEGLLDRDFSDS